MAQGVSNIAQVRALGTPAKQYLWEFIIPQVPAAAGAVAESLTFRARSTAWPGRQVGTAMRHFKGHRMKHPTKNMFPMSLPATFEEGMNGVVAQTMRNWFNAWLSEKDGSSQGESVVKVDALVRLLDHQNQVVLQGHVFGFFIENMPDVPLSYEADGLLSIAVTFGYDYWDLE